jgi:hypothetical protein
MAGALSYWLHEKCEMAPKVPDSAGMRTQRLNSFSYRDTVEARFHGDFLVGPGS